MPVPGEGSVLWGLLDELALEPARIPGSLLGIAYRGRIVTGGRAETFPLRLPLAAAARISFVRAGLRIRRDAERYNELSRRGEGETDSDVRRRLLGFLGDRFSSDEFAEEVFRRWRDSEGRVGEAMQSLGEELTAARDGYRQVKQLDETLFAKDYESL